MTRLSLTVSVLLILLLSGSVWANVPISELTDLRTEYSKTYQLPDGQRTVEISPTPIHRLDVDGEWKVLSPDDEMICRVFDFATGSVTTTVKTTGNLSWVGKSSMQQRTHAWMKFNLDLLPPGDITYAKIEYFLTSLAGNLTTQIMVTHVSTDPVPADASTLFSAVVNGTAMLVGNHTSETPLQEFKPIVLAPAAYDVIAAGRQLSPPWVAFGFRSENNTTGREGAARGYEWPEKPRLVITYSPPPLHDVAVTSITAPVGTVPYGTVVTPTATWKNVGNQPMVFRAFCFLINPDNVREYQRDLPNQNLNPGVSQTIQFEQYLLDHDPGQWQVFCSTYSATDQVKLNDTLRTQFTLAVPSPLIDMEAYDVVDPSGVVLKNTNVLPAGTYRNNSNVAVTFDAYIMLRKPGGEQYHKRYRQVENLAPGADTTISFFDVMLDDVTGNWTARCSVWTAQNDEDPSNDAINETFQVVDELRPPDVAPVQIITPFGYADTGTTLTPRAKWRNLGDVVMTFRAWFSIFDPDNEPVYTQSYEVVGLRGGQDTILAFPEYLTGTTQGDFAIRCSTWAEEDENHANDVLIGKFRVRADLPPWEFGWTEAKRMPDPPSYKQVKAGAWLAYSSGDGKIYAAKGNKTGEFFAYHPFDDSWSVRSDIPQGVEAKMPNKGCNATYDHNRNVIYMTKGANTLGFWRYSIEQDSWQQMRDAPAGMMKKKVKGGANLEYVERDGGQVYLLKGTKTEFYRFNVTADTWEVLPDAPAIPRGKWDAGSFMVYDQERYLYAHMSKMHMMWRFDTHKDSWTSDTLAPMPLPGWHGGKIKNKKMKDGGSAAFYDGYIYALKGGNTQQFFRYEITGDSWTQMDTIPVLGTTGKKKRVKTGADMVSMANGAFFALKGNKCNELWRYVLRPYADGLFGGATSATTLAPARLAMSISPNPMAAGFATLRLAEGSRVRGATVTVFDVSGRSVFSSRSPDHLFTGSLLLDLRKIPSGVYLVRLETDAGSASQKLVVQR